MKTFGTGAIYNIQSPPCLAKSRCLSEDTQLLTTQFCIVMSFLTGFMDKSIGKLLALKVPSEHRKHCPLKRYVFFYAYGSIQYQKKPGDLNLRKKYPTPLHF